MGSQEHSYTGYVNTVPATPNFLFYMKLPHPRPPAREAELGCSLPRDGSWLDQELVPDIRVAFPKTIEKMG